MNIHLKILAVIYLFFGYALLVMFIIGQITFFQYWQNYSSSIFSDAGYFYEKYNDFFAQYGVVPVQTLLVSVSSLAFGHGILRRRKWAKYLGILIAVVNLVNYGWDILNGYFTVSFLLEIVLSAYVLWVLIAKMTVDYFAKSKAVGAIR